MHKPTQTLHKQCLKNLCHYTWPFMNKFAWVYFYFGHPVCAKVRLGYCIMSVSFLMVKSKNTIFIISTSPFRLGCIPLLRKQRKPSMGTRSHLKWKKYTAMENILQNQTTISKYKYKYVTLCCRCGLEKWRYSKFPTC